MADNGYRNRTPGILCLVFFLYLPAAVSATPGTILWKYVWGNGGSGNLTQAAVSGDFAVIPVGVNEVAAIHLSTGRLAWQIKSAAPQINSWNPVAAIWNNRVYLPDNANYAAAKMKCLDLKTGRLLWQYTPPAGTHPGVEYNRKQIMSRIPVKNGRIYFSDFQGVIYCLDALSGQLHWRSDVNALLNRKQTHSWKLTAYGYQGELYIEGDCIIGRTNNLDLVCLNLADGSKRWTKSFTGWRESDIDILGAAGGRVYIVYAPWKHGARKEAHTLVAINTVSGREVWRSPRLPGTESNSLEMINGRLELTGINALYGSPDHLSYLTRLHPSTGRIIGLRKLWFSMRSAARIEAGRRYYLRWDFHGQGVTRTFDMVLYCEDAENGRFYWKRPLLVKSRDWYHSGRVPKTRAAAITVQDGRAVVSIEHTVWCVQTGTISPATDSTGGGVDPHESD